MFLKKLEIENYKLFDSKFIIDDFNIPNKNDEGSGLTLIVGENGCGKTSILDAIALSLIDYKIDSFKINNMSSINKKTVIRSIADKSFTVSGVYPKVTFSSDGFEFNANLRKKKSSSLSTLVVKSQKYVKSENDNTKTVDADLRVNVTGPFGNKRHSNLNVLYLDKNRLYQTKTGTFSETRFDRIMEDLNYQFINKEIEPVNLNDIINSTIKKELKNDSLVSVVKKFKEISGYSIKLDTIDNYKPFSHARFVIEGEMNNQESLEDLGSGYEMIFSLIYAYYMTVKDSELIILIDEPELHLHPKLQKKFIDFLLKISKNSQVIITSHSPLLVKQIMYNKNIKSIVLNKNKIKSSIEDLKLSYLSSNEINYIAFGLATEEYHNELYEEIYSNYSKDEEMSIKCFDNEYFIQKKQQKALYPYKSKEKQVSIHTYIRNQIHHQSYNGKPDTEELNNSIEFMRKCLEEEKSNENLEHI